MCKSQRKEIKRWFYNQETIELVKALAVDLGLAVKGVEFCPLTIEDVSNAYPELVITRRGNPSDGGGTWLHPDLAVQLAQWCNPVE